MNGWIKIHRKIIDWEWYSDHNTTRLFIHLLLIANHEPTKWRGRIIKEGEVLTGRILLSEQTGLSQQEIRTSLFKLKSTSNLTIHTTNRFSIISIINWRRYQIKENKTTSRSTNQTSLEQPTSNHIQETKEEERRKEVKKSYLNIKDIHRTGDNSESIKNIIKRTYNR